MPTSSILWYFADPMCSWCWGFSEVIEKIKTDYDAKLNIALMLGGLRPGTTEAISDTLRAEILHHWREVQKLTGQSFRFDGALPAGFVYDTEPPSRAVITVASLEPDKTFAYFKSIQAGFYLEQQDVTQAKTLAQLATQQGLDAGQFLAQFNSEAAKQKTQQHFQGARQAGVRGFPSLVLQHDSEYDFISRGYRPYAELQPIIDSWLAQYPAA